MRTSSDYQKLLDGIVFSNAYTGIVVIARSPTFVVVDTLGGDDGCGGIHGHAGHGD